jgi:hypothetical protein
MIIWIENSWPQIVSRSVQEFTLVEGIDASDGESGAQARLSLQIEHRRALVELNRPRRLRYGAIASFVSVQA